MIGDRIKELRNEKGLYQQDLADKLNVSKSTIAMWETNKREPSAGALIELADFFNCTVDYLMGHNNNPELEELPPDLIILNRKAKNLSPEKIQKLLDVANAMFKEDFNE